MDIAISLMTGSDLSTSYTVHLPLQFSSVGRQEGHLACKKSCTGDAQRFIFATVLHLLHRIWNAIPYSIIDNLKQLCTCFKSKLKTFCYSHCTCCLSCNNIKLVIHLLSDMWYVQEQQTATLVQWLFSSSTRLSQYRNATILDFIRARMMEVVVTTGALRRVKLQSSSQTVTTNIPTCNSVSRPTYIFI